MKSDELKSRTKDFALRIMRLVEALPRSPTADILGRQVLRSATSVAANYRAACRARSRSEFIAKMGTVEEESDETAFWLELIVDSGMLPAQKVSELLAEANALTAIAVASIRTARRSAANPQSAIRNPQSR